MKAIVYTQRVDLIESYNERRDCADHNIARFILACGFLPVAVNNVPEYVVDFINHVKPQGIILTGGNDIAKYGGNAPERDETEYKLIKLALEKDIPILGFCRGAQIIADYFDSNLTRVNNHVALRHSITGEISGEVNSFHNYAIEALPESFTILARSDDNIIEAYKHKDKKVFGIMWHLERETPFSQNDIDFVTHIFC